MRKRGRNIFLAAIVIFAVVMILFSLDTAKSQEQPLTQFQYYVGQTVTAPVTGCDTKAEAIKLLDTGVDDFAASLAMFQSSMTCKGGPMTFKILEVDDRTWTMNQHDVVYQLVRVDTFDVNDPSEVWLFTTGVHINAGAKPVGYLIPIGHMGPPPEGTTPVRQVIICDLLEQAVDIVQTHIDENAQAAGERLLHYYSVKNPDGEPSCAFFPSMILVKPVQSVFNTEVQHDGHAVEMVVFEIEAPNGKSMFMLMAKAKPKVHEPLAQPAAQLISSHGGMPELPMNQLIAVNGLTLCDTAEQMMHIVQTEIDEGVEASKAVFDEYNSTLNAVGQPICGSLSRVVQLVVTNILFEFDSEIHGKVNPAVIFEFLLADGNTYVGYLVWVGLGNKGKTSGQDV